MNNEFDIIIPDLRGTGRSSLLRCPSSLSVIACQKLLAQQFGIDTSLSGFSVNEMAADIIDMIQSIKKQGDVIYLYGLYFGSYIIDRILRIDPSITNAVVMDGVCTPPYCNATDTDVFFNSVGIQILTQCTKNSTKCRNTLGQSTDVVSKYLALQKEPSVNGVYKCGLSYDLIAFQNRSLSGMALLNPALKGSIPALISRSDRCSIYDATALAVITSQIQSYLAKSLDPLRSDIIHRHIVLSEFVSTSLSVDEANRFDDNAAFTTYSRSTLAKQLRDGWIPYNTTPLLPNNYTGPLLMLNGDMDPFNPLSRIYNASQLVVFSGIGFNTARHTPMRSNSSLHCAQMIISQFFASPNNSINATCVSEVVVPSYEDSSAFTADLWDGIFRRTSVDVSAGLFSAISCSILFFVTLLCLLCVIIFYNKQPVRSRFIAPYIGNVTVLVITAGNIYIGAAQWERLYPVYSSILRTITNALIAIAVLALFIQALRFYLLRYLYKTMGTTKNDYTKILKVLTSKITYAVIMCISIVFWFFLFGISLGVANSSWGNYNGDFNGNLTYLELAYALILLILLVILFIIDIFFISKTWKNPIFTFFVDDPLLFRLDTIFFLISYFFFIMYNILSQFFDGYLIFVLQFLAYTFAILFSGGTAVIAVFVRYIRGIADKASTTDILDRTQRLQVMVADPKGLELISTYARAEFSYENVAVVVDVKEELETYSAKTDPEKYAVLDRLVTTYLDRNSDMEVNVPGNVRQAVLALHGRMGVENTVGEGMAVLESLLSSCVITLCDTFTRYEDTKQCKEFWSYMKAANDIKIV
jgi:pimeloyl-ACP methyl ester carboxylesterase